MCASDGKTKMLGNLERPHVGVPGQLFADHTVPNVCLCWSEKEKWAMLSFHSIQLVQSSHQDMQFLPSCPPSMDWDIYLFLVTCHLLMIPFMLIVLGQASIEKLSLALTSGVKGTETYSLYPKRRRWMSLLTLTFNAPHRSSWLIIPSRVWWLLPVDQSEVACVY